MVWGMYFAIYMKLLNSRKVFVGDWNAVFDPKIDRGGGLAGTLALKCKILSQNYKQARSCQ